MNSRHSSERTAIQRTRPEPAFITGVILAGGRARRMGGHDKGLLSFAGRPLVEWVIESLRPQVGDLLISANRHPRCYAAYGLPVVPDLEPGFQGPLAGVLSAMLVARTDWILTLPCDGPRPPTELRARLARVLIEQGADLAVATDGNRTQPLYALLPVTLADSLRGFLAGSERRVESWQARHRVALADFSDRPDGFVNLNTLEDLRALERFEMDRIDRISQAVVLNHVNPESSC